MQGPYAFDLFSGCGGMSLGIEAAGITTSLAVDHWSPAVSTFAANFPYSKTLNADLRSISATELVTAGGKAPSLIAGGPPCQGFSSAGLRKSGDVRNSLVRHFGVLVAEILPPTVLFENVEGFLTAENGRYVFDLLEPLLEAGYNLHVRKVNAANYGAPQLRKRVLVLGGLRGNLPFAAPTHFAFGAPGADAVGRGLPYCPTLNDALRDLPPAQRRGQEVVQGHYAVSSSRAVAERMRLLPQGGTMRDLPPALQHPTYVRRAKRRVKDGTPLEARGGAPAGLRRLRSDRPSKAVTGGGYREFVHPTEDRYLTLRECARLQGFPDNFRFYGTQSDQAQMIGNAVPVALAHRIANPLTGWLSISPKPTVRRSGRLLSLKLTTGNGMSPALQRVMIELERRFGPLPDTTPLFDWSIDAPQSEPAIDSGESEKSRRRRTRGSPK